MRVAVAVVGAVIVFFLTILIWGIGSGFLPQFPQPVVVPVLPFATNPILTDPRIPGALRMDNVAGLLLALLAALGSYSASGRRRRE